MNQEHINKLKSQFPNLFPNRWSLPSCGDGWFDIVYKICTQICLYLNFDGNSELKQKFYVVQIKEKFGDLQFYVSHSNSSINNIINKNVSQSNHICEICGKSNATKKVRQAWYKTICKSCADEIGGYTEF